jgi:hypothetical protein
MLPIGAPNRQDNLRAKLVILRSVDASPFLRKLALSQHP